MRFSHTEPTCRAPSLEISAAATRMEPRTASSGIAAAVAEAITIRASVETREGGTTSSKVVPWRGSVRTITSPPRRSSASRTTSRPMPRPETSVTARDVLMPPRNSRRTSSSAPSSPAFAPNSPRRTAMRCTAAKSRPRPSSRHVNTIRLPRRKTSTLTLPALGLPSERRSVSDSVPCATALRTICMSAPCMIART